MPKYRPNVAALIVNPHGELLICERRNIKNGWQFPQGGVQKGESLLDALKREIREEVNLKPKSYEVCEVKSGYRYLYPPKVAKKKGWAGQEQTYYLCRLHDSTSLDIDLGPNNPEFGDYDWVRPADFESTWLPEFKLGVYRQVMWDFFNVDIGGEFADSIQQKII